MIRKYIFQVQVPILLLVLCNSRQGPVFLHVVLSVLFEHEERVIPVTLIHDVGNRNWGTFKYTSSADRPAEEENWYGLLSKSDKAIYDHINWWQQLCLNWPVLTKDLQNLSRATTVVGVSRGKRRCTTDQIQIRLSCFV